MRKFKKWYSSNRVSEFLAMLILVEEWKEGLQQREGRTNKMYNNAVMVEKKILPSSGIQFYWKLFDSIIKSTVIMTHAVLMTIGNKTHEDTQSNQL